MFPTGACPFSNNGNVDVDPSQDLSSSHRMKRHVEGGADPATTTKEGKDKSVKTADEKTKDKSVKPSGDNAEASSGDKGKSLNKEPKKK